MQHLLVNSFPNSGTNMLLQIVRADWHIRRYETDVGGIKRDIDTIREDLWESFQPLTNKRRCVGHVPWNDTIYYLLEKMGIKTILLIRDPRDCVVAHMFHVKKFFASSAQNFRVSGQLLHTRPDPMMDIICGLGERLAEITPWISRANDYKDANILPLKYESFRTVPLATCQEMIKFAPDVFRNESSTTLAQRIKPNESPTFRKGTIGDWKNHFKAKHIKTFWKDNGIVEAMRIMGYEK